MELTNKKITLLGDFILDHYIIGNIKGYETANTSLILNKQEEYTLLGGAANVALQLSSITNERIDFYFKINNYDGVKELTDNYVEYINFLPFENKQYSQLPIKHRYMCSDTGYQLLRVDEEHISNVSVYSSLKANNFLNLNNTDLILISDYDKGTLDSILMKQIIESNKFHIIDGKAPNSYLFKYTKILFPNDREYKEFIRDSSLIDKIPFIVHKCGKDGVILEGWNESIGSILQCRIPVPECFKDKLVDSCGCGDIIFAVTAAFLPKDLNQLTFEYLTKCVEIAVYCASYSAVKKERIAINQNIINEAIEYIEDHN